MHTWLMRSLLSLPSLVSYVAHRHGILSLNFECLEQTPGATLPKACGFVC